MAIRYNQINQRSENDMEIQQIGKISEPYQIGINNSTAVKTIRRRRTNDIYLRGEGCPFDRTFFPVTINRFRGYRKMGFRRSNEKKNIHVESKNRYNGGRINPT